MSQVWKFPMNQYEASLEMPENTQILTAQHQLGTGVCIWGLVPDPKAPKVKRYFFVVGTGHEIAQEGTYIATFQSDYFVWHLFEVKK